MTTGKTDDNSDQWIWSDVVIFDGVVIFKEDTLVHEFALFNIGICPFTIGYFHHFYGVIGIHTQRGIVFRFISEEYQHGNSIAGEKSAEQVLYRGF